MRDDWRNKSDLKGTSEIDRTCYGLVGSTVQGFEKRERLNVTELGIEVWSNRLRLRLVASE